MNGLSLIQLMSHDALSKCQKSGIRTCIPLSLSVGCELSGHLLSVLVYMFSAVFLLPM